MLFSSCTKEQHKTVYLSLIWHQHQPSYEDSRKRALIGPWVRTHATKDYFDMAYRIRKYPNLHLTINLSSVLLNQLQTYYINRLKPFIHLANEEFRVEEFKTRYGGKTDPWLDLLITNSANFTAKQRDYLYNWSGKQAWNCFSVSENMIKWFPEYIKLIPEGMTIGSFKGTKKRKNYTIQDRINLKFLFAVANFDPMFLRGPVRLPIRNERGEYVYSRVHRWIRYEPGDSLNQADDRYYLKGKITEKDCQQLVVEIYKVLLSVMKIHKKLKYDPFTNRGQIELVTTPYYHPILPLMYDTDVMKVNQPDDPTPIAFSYPEDAKWQVRKGISLYKSIFRDVPSGMWPGEGSVSKDVIHIFSDEGIQWIATGPQVLAKSLGKNDIHELSRDDLATFYNVKGMNNSSIGVLFRDLNISDDIAFNYPRMKPREAVNDFVKKILAYEKSNRPDPLVTVLLDGENCWENFVYTHDGNEFLNLFYQTLDSLQKAGRIQTVTPIEYIKGNPHRNIKPHPLYSEPSIEELWPGCWFSPDFSVWIGEEEENTAWEYLGETRKVFDELRLIYNPQHPNKYIKRAWEEMFAAEGSDWFWWYGNDQTAPGGADLLFDINFRLHLKNVFYYLRRAGFDVKSPDFPPIISRSQQLIVETPFEKQPRINGYIEKLWKTGAYIVDDEGGAQFSKSDLIKAIYAGYKDNDLFVAIDAGTHNLQNELLNDSSRVYVYLLKSDKNYLNVNQKSQILNRKQLPNLLKKIRIFAGDEDEIMANDTTITVSARRNRLELHIPETWESQEPIQVFVQYRKGNLVDFAPNAGMLTLKKKTP
jgi:alpha-amylase/alpha-mannosidase (GH57 family)